MDNGIVEIIGPPGIGKTTIYTAVCRKWRPSFRWTYPDALLTTTPPFSDFSNWVEHRLKGILKKRLSRSVPSEFGLRFAQSHPELANFCWNELSREDVYPIKGPEMRFRSVFHLYLDFCRYQAIAEAKPAFPCLLSEGLLQKSFLIRNNHQATMDRLGLYLPLVPLPKAIIFINSQNRELIVERLRSRSKTLAIHQNKSGDELMQDIIMWQYQFHLISRWMLKQGVKVYNIDGAKPVSENSLLISRILEMLEGSGSRIESRINS